VLFLLAGTVTTAALFITDAFFAFAGWRILVKKQTGGRASVVRGYARMERHEPTLAAVAMTAAAALAIRAGFTHVPGMCLAGSAFVAIGAHLLLHLKTVCLMQRFEEAPVCSAEWHTRAAKLEAVMLTRASLQGAAFICLLAAGSLS
jgi:hypothetical protein